MKVKRRHKVVKKLLMPFFNAAMRKQFALQLEKSDLKPPFLVLGNHTTDYDAFFIAGAFKCPIYFVMSDHVSSIPVAGKLVKFLLSPLPITKSSIDAGVVREIISAVKQGASVGIFPEGNKSFAGDMSYIKPSIAKLAKKLNIPVVLFNIEGGYFSQPRWAKNKKRKGRLTARVGQVISPEEMKEMTNEQLYDRIVSGLRVNAYEVQEKNPVDYVGKGLAEGIETMLYACPECGAIGTIRSEGDVFWCSACKDACTYTSKGYVVGGHFDRLDKWDEWQKKHIASLNLAHTPNDVPLLHDTGWEVMEKEDKYNNKQLGNFETFLFSDRLLIANKETRIELPIADIVGMGVEGACGLQLWIADGRVYRLKNQAPASALKYADFIWTIQGKLLKF